LDSRWETLAESLVTDGRKYQIKGWEE
jgi:hypothetical protein